MTMTNNDRRTEARLREEITHVCHLMYEKGFIWASDGNVSARLSPGRILITPSGLHKGFLQPNQILLVNDEGQRLAASTPANRDLKPTSELPMHLEAYRRRPDIGAVVHAHPPITVALSIAGISMADCLLPETVVFLGTIPTTAYATPSSEENVRAIRDLIVNHDALVLQRHGSLTVGRDPMQGFMRLETMEQNARVAFMLAQLGVRNPLPPEETRKLLELRRQLGLSRPGEEAEFCQVCGVCHEGDSHIPQPQMATAVPHTISNPDDAVIRQIVSRVVRETVGRG
jgi:L-fuculose-phosphate aldolase